MAEAPDGFTILPDNPAPELAQAVWYSGPDGRRLRAMFAPAPSRFSAPRGTVIVCPGRTEFIEKYFEVARDMQTRGFAVVVFDWPGQGLSERDLPDRLAGHIQSFDLFVEALRIGVAHLRSRLVEPFVMLAHSMGGAIGLEALRTHRIDVEAAAFSAPLWGLKVPPLAMTISRLLCGFGQGRAIISAHKMEETFEENEVTNDPDRWRLQRELAAANPDLALGSVTWRWVNAVLHLFEALRQPGALNAIQIPILVATAQEEMIVENGAHEEIAARLVNAEHITIPGAKHEIMMETDERRAMFFKAFDNMLARANI